MKILGRSLFVTLMLTAFGMPAFAQSTSISGVVVDASGGVIPGATVSARNDATAGVATAVTSSNGTFSVPSLSVGTYTVTVSLDGFRTVVLKGVTATAGGPASVRAVLQVGSLSESIVVEGAAAMIQTQSSAASTTLNTKQIGNLPLATRDTLDFLTLLPGVSTPFQNQGTTVEGLPQTSINITLDGVNVQDNFGKSTNGFFARVSPRLDAVEEVSVTTAGSVADASGNGATQIRFTTRSGSDTFTGSLYEYFQNDKLQTNTYFNQANGLPKGDFLQNQPGFRLGGPILIPGLYNGRGKAFFFVNYEQLRQPGNLTQNSNFLTDPAQSGVFRYLTATGVQSVNLLALAAANGQTATTDPTIAKLLSDIKASTLTTGTVSALDGNFTAQKLAFQQPLVSLNHYPTFRVDYNLTAKHRLNASYTFNHITLTPDNTRTGFYNFPGFPISAYQINDRKSAQISERAVLSSVLISELRVGRSWGPAQFGVGIDPTLWTSSVANQGGYALNINTAGGITNAGRVPTSNSLLAQTWFVDEKITYARGSHSMSLGGTAMKIDVWQVNRTAVPTIGFGMVTGDPALAMFSAANFIGSSAADRTNAQNLYAVLTGRVNSITGTSALDPSTGKYVYNGDSRTEGKMYEFDVFAQDSWRVRSNLTFNFGLRYVMQMPFQALNNSYSVATVDDAWGISGNVAGCSPSNPSPATCNLFKAGTVPGAVPTFKNLTTGVNVFNPDWNNFAPSVGMNWTPHVDSGLFSKLLGGAGDTSVSAGWSRSYERHGMQDFTNALGANPGATITAARNAANGNLGGLPVLFRNASLSGPSICTGAVTAACVPDAPLYPIATSVTGSLTVYDPDLQVPYSDTYTVGLQRALGKKSAFEVRYVGSRNREQWQTNNLNETNILENGFLSEFKLAQQNLYANNASGVTGRVGSFAYFGTGTGTSPLPIFLAHLNGLASVNAADRTKYTGTNWSSSNYVNSLSIYAPNPFLLAGTNAASGLNGSAAFRANAVLAGLPRNFFVANPDVLGGANVIGNSGFTNYNSMQVQFRQRLSHGLQFDANYNVGRQLSSVRYSYRVPVGTVRGSGAQGDTTQSFKATFVYQLPFGKDQPFLNGLGPILDRIIGGWQISGTTRIQTGRLVDLGNVRVIGMTQKDVQAAFSLRKISDATIVMWPDDILTNTIKAFSTDVNGYTQGAPTGRYFAPANGPDCIETIANNYGDCGARTLTVTGPMYRNMDFSISKDIRFAGRKSISIRVDGLNVFDAVNFVPVSGIGGAATSNYQLTQALSGRTIQLVGRFNW